MLYRSINLPIKIETREDGKRYIEGYAAVFYRKEDEGTQYHLWDDLVERIAPGAFKRAIAEKDDVRALLNHEPSYLLARVGNGLNLKEDKIGLFYSFPVDSEDPDHIRTVRKIERGDMTGSSFGFIPQKRTFIEGEDNEPDVIVQEEVRLFDVSPVTYPAYEATQVGLRHLTKESMEELRKDYEYWKKEQHKPKDPLAYYKIQLLKAEAGIL